MAFGNTPKDNAQTPLGSVYVPNTSNSDLTTLRGANTSTDGLGQKSAAASMVLENAVPLGQATKVNSSPVALPSDQVSSGISDGVLPANVLGEAIYLYSSGGPVDSTGKPQQASFDRMKSWQGSAVATGTITATVAGNTTLVFSVAPQTIMPGQKIQLGVGVETVIVATSYVPSSTATTIPLQYPVVSAGSTSASWDTYSPLGNSGNPILSTGVGISVLALSNPAGFSTLGVASNAVTDGMAGFKFQEVVPGLFNGTYVDLQRGNLDNIALITAAAATATQTGADQTNFNARGVIVTLDVTAGAALSLTPHIQMKDPNSGKYVDIISGAVTAITGISTTIYTLYPGIATTAGIATSMVLPRTWRVQVVHGNATAATYKVSASLIV